MTAIADWAWRSIAISNPLIADGGIVTANLNRPLPQVAILRSVEPKVLTGGLPRGCRHSRYAAKKGQRIAFERRLRQKLMERTLLRK